VGTSVDVLCYLWVSASWGLTSIYEKRRRAVAATSSTNTCCCSVPPPDASACCPSSLLVASSLETELKVSLEEQPRVLWRALCLFSHSHSSLQRQWGRHRVTRDHNGPVGKVLDTYCLGDWQGQEHSFVSSHLHWLSECVQLFNRVDVAGGTPLECQIKNVWRFSCIQQHISMVWCFIAGITLLLVKGEHGRVKVQKNFTYIS
jgi:hypothetical protein